MNYNEDDLSRIDNFITFLAKFKGLKESSLVIYNQEEEITLPVLGKRQSD